VKNADVNELRSIASPPEVIHMYNVKDFSFLLDIVDDLSNNICNSVKGPGEGGNHLLVAGTVTKGWVGIRDIYPQLLDII
jgi:hypothetical protein